MRHLLSIEDLDRDEIERILSAAAFFADVADRPIKKVPSFRGRLVINLFYEASTRTRSSFELAAKRLSADVLNVVASGSSVEKGESLHDTVSTLSAYGPDVIVIRSPHAGAPGLVAGWTHAAVVNAGDGKHQHPTQALLDVYVLRQRLGSLEGCDIWIVGDVLHSRVARSCVVYALRLQQERMSEDFLPSLREYAANYQLNSRRLKARQLVMHPGPVNRGVEISGELIDSSQSLIIEQVRAGIVVRMAVLVEVLSGTRVRDPGGQRLAVSAEPQLA
jgi:aspartate carbamoyltransferase catalytic subunit